MTNPLVIFMIGIVLGGIVGVFFMAVLLISRDQGRTTGEPQGAEAQSSFDDVDAIFDNAAVDEFAAAMKAKLAKKRAEGYGGWHDPVAVSNGRLAGMLVEHMGKGDPVDVGNFAMMLHWRCVDLFVLRRALEINRVAQSEPIPAGTR